LLLLSGFTAVLFEVRWLTNHGLGWPCIVAGALLLFVRLLVSIRIENRSNSRQTKGRGAAPQIQTAPRPVFVDPPSAASGNAISFVAPVAGGDSSAPLGGQEIISKTIAPEVLNIRFVAHRCEISNDTLRVIYQNGTQRELKWFEVGAIVIRQLPYERQWEGKLILDIIPNAMSKEKVQPIRILSSTFANYSFLPQGQSASTRENMRRLAAFALMQHRLIYLDPGTDYFVHAGQPPVRFFSMSQFSEYDSRYL